MCSTCFMVTALLCAVGTLCNPIDQHATSHTRMLFQRLVELAKNPHKIIFGQQRATQTGVYGWKTPYRQEGSRGWAYTPKMSHESHIDELCDIKSVTGDYPGIVGFNLHDLSEHDLDLVLPLTRQMHKRGGLVTYHMPMSNPVTGGSENIKGDRGAVLHSVRKILPGGANNAHFQQILDRLAEFAKNVTDHNGNLIPVIFRPFHETNGAWFWWGQNNEAHNSANDYISLWRYTVEYLRDTKKVHNFLYAYAPSDQFIDLHTDGHHVTSFMKTYPGDQFVDIMAIDAYHNVMADSTVPVFVKHVEQLVFEAEKRGKIAAIAEIGLKNSGINTHHNFWLDRVLNPLKAHQSGRRIAYIMTWSNRCNHHDCEIWTPYHGHPAASAFMNFYHDNVTVFAKTVPNMYT